MTQHVNQSVSDRTKALLVDPLKRIELDDFVNEQLRRAMAALSGDHFPTSGSANRDDFVKRVAAYEATVADLQTIAILLARWGDSEQILLLEKIVSCLGETDKGSGGLVWWLRLGWYPLLVIMYSAGIAALSARRHEALGATLATPVLSDHRGMEPVVIPVMTAMTEIANAFKAMPGYERHHVPRSEQLFTTLRPALDDALFLGSRYEFLFDRYEILLALTYADFHNPAGDNVWGPPGRFSWKHGRSENPLSALIAEATEQGANWPYLSSGLFGGNQDRFLKVANAYKQLLDRSPRW